MKVKYLGETAFLDVHRIIASTKDTQPWRF